jgi:hypothetical protein
MPAKGAAWVKPTKPKVEARSVAAANPNLFGTLILLSPYEKREVGNNK